MTRSPAERLEELRRNRVRPQRAAALGPLAVEVGRDLKRLQRRLGAVAEAWVLTCPPALVARTAVEGVSRGVLLIRVDNAAARFEVDRWMREGGERELIRRCPITVRKVRVLVGLDETPSADHEGGRRESARSGPRSGR